jgi:hypothetical protein
MSLDTVEREMGSLDNSDSFNGHVESAKDYEGESHVLDMQQRARLLLEELEQFQTYLKEKKKEDTVHLSSFKTDVQHELKLLEKVRCETPYPKKAVL